MLGEVSFNELEYQYVQEWDQSVKDGKLTIIKMPDDSSLYLSTLLTEPDQQYLAKAFWDQRGIVPLDVEIGEAALLGLSR